SVSASCRVYSLTLPFPCSTIYVIYALSLHDALPIWNHCFCGGYSRIYIRLCSRCFDCRLDSSSDRVSLVHYLLFPLGGKGVFDCRAVHFCGWYDCRHTRVLLCCCFVVGWSFQLLRFRRACRSRSCRRKQ